MRFCTLFAITALSLIPISTRAADTPATAPADISLSALRVAHLKPSSYIFKPFHGTYAQAGEQASNILPDLYTKLLTMHITPISGPIVVVMNPTNDRAAEYDMQIGVPIKENDPAPDGYQQRQLDGDNFATALICGPMLTMGDTIHNFFQQLRARHVQTGPEFRMRFLYWEDVTSPNNVIQLEVGTAS